MGKYDQSKRFKKIEARVDHSCSNCGEGILPGESYYREDRFLQSLHARDFCTKCYEKYGESLLTPKKKRRIDDKKSKTISDYV